MEAKHEPVLMNEVLDALSVAPGDVVVDGTLGGAGHFGRLLAALGSEGVIVGIDADPAAVERARAAYAEDRRAERPTAHLINDNFRNLSRILERLGVGQADKVLFDLGWSGYQVASPRGFSFQEDEPLLMAYGEGGETAADLVNSLPEQALSDLIYTYGEERFARSIARAIVLARGRQRILTTSQLVDAVMAGTPAWYHRRKIHPATKTFQALRIAVNDELGALREGLAAALDVLSPGGRLAVISFHSIEDRVVKGVLTDAVHAGRGSLSPKKPVAASRAEVLANRRSRSAKLRVFVRCPKAECAPEAAGAGSILFSYA
jgi:16S rRNA (cytosine1402-N4)-methyltransferase